MFIYTFKSTPTQCFIVCKKEEEINIPQKFLNFKNPQIINNLKMINWVKKEIEYSISYPQKMAEVKEKYSVYYAAEHLLGGIVGTAHWESDYKLLSLQEAQEYPEKYGYVKIIKSRENFDAPQKPRYPIILYES